MKRLLCCLLFGCVLAVNLPANCFGQDELNQEVLDDGRGSEVQPPTPPEPPNQESVLENTAPEQHRPDDQALAFELNLLFRNRNVQKELQLTRSQRDELRKIQSEMVTEISPLVEQLRKISSKNEDGPDDDERARYIGDLSLLEDELEFRQAQFYKRMKGVLLPEQVTWLTQAATQFQVRKTAVKNQPVLLNEKLVEKLGINGKQISEMQELWNQSEQELEGIIGKHREAAQKDLLKVLSPEQRGAFKEIFERKIEF